MRIRIRRPSDFHAHLRWGPMFDAVAPEVMRHYRYALVMPNGGPGAGDIIRSVQDAAEVYCRIMEIRHEQGLRHFQFPVMTIYHTTDITVGVVDRLLPESCVLAIKNYPAHGGTTQSGHGVPFDEHENIIHAMEVCGVPLLIHAEDVCDEHGNVLPHAEREAHCVTHRLRRFREKHPKLKICIEHASTREAIEFVRADTSGNTVMTATPQHLLFTKTDFGKWEWRNHLRCMPIVKDEEDRLALLEFVTSGDPRCIAGSDTAPHLSQKKAGAFEDAACGCWTPHAIGLYALAFSEKGPLEGAHLHNFERFMSLNGPAWWGLKPPSEDDLVTISDEHPARAIPNPTRVPQMDDIIIPLGWWSDPAGRLPLQFSAEECA